MKQISRPFISRGIVLWGSVIALACLALIAFGSPIFRVLGFEYSALSALMLSLAVGFVSVSGGVRSFGLKELALRSLGLWAIPILLSTLSTASIPNCGFLDGAVFYLEITLPTTLLALAFGLAIGRIVNSHRLALWLFAAFWAGTFIISLLPGYLFSQLFTYGWQYGFFPGLVWDEYIELGSGYNWHLLEWATLAAMLLLASTKIVRRQKWIAFGALLVLYAGLLFNRSNNRVVSSHGNVEEELSSTLRAGIATVHFNGSLTRDEQRQLQTDIIWYIHDIRKRLGLKDTNTIHIYLYPNVESLYRNVGTRSASIAKPWLSELHIAQSNLHSLRHELVHVLVREWKNFPFNASWSTGMTEGVAEAMEPTYDGLHTVDEHASAILHLQLADGIRNVMSFTGFASGASTLSYVLAGSFSKYLLEQYPVSDFSEVYTSLDFEGTYGKSLAALEREWKARILPLASSMDAYDSLRAYYYFSRNSIIYQPCLRRMGKLSHEAQIAMKAHLYKEAETLYQEIHEEAHSISSLRGMVTARLSQGDLDGAKQMLLTTPMEKHPQRFSLSILKGDLLEESHYDTLIALELSSSSLLDAFARKHLNDRDRYIRQLYSNGSSIAEIPLDLSGTEYAGQAPYAYVPDYLTGKAYEDVGMYTQALYYYDKCLKAILADSTATVINWPLVLKVMDLDPFYLPEGNPASAGLNAEWADRMKKLKYFREQSRDPHAAVQ